MARPRTPFVRLELEQIVAEYHHLRAEHRRAGPESSVRRRMEARLEELDRRFERLLEEWVPEERLRQAWREYLHGEGPEPPEPEPIPPLLYRGRAESGSLVEVRERFDGDCDVLVDGTLVERVSAEELKKEKCAPLTFRVGEEEFHEVFAAPAPALEALRAYFASPDGEPPWEHALALAADGLVDRTFALTARGCRFLAAREARP
ncbi:MAG: hypothetical protein C4306_06750 [Thermoleophilia bacterium]